MNGALRAQVKRDRKLAAMDAFLRDFEAEQGEITDTEIAAATRDARARAAGSSNRCGATASGKPD